MSIKIKEFKVGKGKTVQHGEEWIKTYYELVVDTEGIGPEEVEVERQTAEGYLDKLLESHARTPSVEPADFNPEELMQHKWKGKKISYGQYEHGSLEWGWDFQDKFSAEVIKALPLVIDNYEFSLSDRGTVQVRKVKP